MLSAQRASPGVGMDGAVRCPNHLGQANAGASLGGAKRKGALLGGALLTPVTSGCRDSRLGPVGHSGAVHSTGGAPQWAGSLARSVLRLLLVLLPLV